MNTITPKSLKKLLYSSALALLLIIIFVIAKLIYFKEKKIELKHFDTASEQKKSTPPKTSRQEASKEKFILLPKR